MDPYDEAEALRHAMSPGPPYRGGALDVFANITSGFYQPPKMFILARFGRWRAIRNLAVEAETEAIAAAASSLKTDAAAGSADAANAGDSVDSRDDFDDVRGDASTSVKEKEGGASDTKNVEKKEEEEEEEESPAATAAATAASLNTAEGWTAAVSDTAWGRAVWAGAVYSSHHHNEGLHFVCFIVHKPMMKKARIFRSC